MITGKVSHREVRYSLVFAFFCSVENVSTPILCPPKPTSRRNPLHDFLPGGTPILEPVTWRCEQDGPTKTPACYLSRCSLARFEDNLIQSGCSPGRRRALPRPISAALYSQMAQPALALSLLQELGLAPAVYNPPENLVPPQPEGGFDWARGAAVARAAARLLAARSAESTTGHAENDNISGAAQVAGVIGAAGVGEKAKSPSPQPCDETREGEKPRAERKGAVDVTTPEEGSQLVKKGEEGSGDARKTEAPATLLRELFLCAALLPLAGVQHKAKKGKLVPAAQSAVADSLKVLPRASDLQKATERKSPILLSPLSFSMIRLLNICR